MSPAASLPAGSANESSQHSVLFGQILSYDELQWEAQGEISSALPFAMRFGTLIRNSANIWIYLCKTTPTLIFHSYYLDGRADRYLIIDEVLDQAIPDPPFELVISAMEVLAVATYYFIGKRLATDYELTLTAQLRSALQSLCQRALGDGSRETFSKVVTLRLTPKALATFQEESGTSGDEQRPGDAAERSESDRIVSRNLSSSSVDDPVDATSRVSRILALESEANNIQEQMDQFGVEINSLYSKLDELNEQVNQVSDESQSLMHVLAVNRAKREHIWELLTAAEVEELLKRRPEGPQETHEA